MTIEQINKPLREQMERKGYRLTTKNCHTFFTDKHGRYKQYPPGYITGPSKTADNYYMYISVKLKGGSWTQRTFLPHEMKEFIAWAIKTSQEQTS